jgi:hypothetical protein
MPAPYLPTQPYELSAEEKERRRKEAEEAARLALNQSHSSKPSYLDSTVASVASRVNKRVAKREERGRDDEVWETRHSPLFDAAEPYTGDHMAFVGF